MTHREEDLLIAAGLWIAAVILVLAVAFALGGLW